ncbi:hypothetical protein MNBD_GAMMA25-2659 [hydrothermal vent metagenome]|uniref:HMA domain-containing protein n=1 Tax=hydrothermal vent metagenome TaxID=652676 RepID=A0A3B1B658_9ZZZZ
MNILHLRISGMTCDFCAAKIKKTLEASPGIKAGIFFDNGLAILESSDSINESVIMKSIQQLNSCSKYQSTFEKTVRPELVEGQAD